ncbi:MAG: hypothetical protein KJZ62_00095 [Fimbriimonadaceae bacterium]|nr:hypothetical protein [Fimbriimonadaceae bacterium]
MESMTERPCPDRVRAYHEAGHAVLDLVFGYGLAHCSIESAGDEIGGVTKRISESVADGHYPLIVAAGTWAEGTSGHDFEAEPCEDGSGGDRLNLQEILLDLFEIPEAERDARNVSVKRQHEIDAMFDSAYDRIFEAVVESFNEPGRIDLLHEVSSLLLEHRTLPQDVLDNLNERYPIRTSDGA